ncbi:MAG: hypothetical protein JXA89_00840 [Anaerolineae bacterium]|nr:hypothetical protein [Anaerolineae bacterium]
MTTQDREQKRSKNRIRVEPPLLIALVLILVAMIFFDRPLVVGDGLAYLIWLDSMVLDGDLDLSNQAEKFADVNTYHIYLNPETGRWASAFPLGIALLLLPFYRIAAWLDVLPIFRINDLHFWGIQGISFVYGLTIMIGINLYTLLTVTLGYGIARRFTRPWPAAVIVSAIYFGTPLFFYTSIEPLNSHIGGAIPATLFIWLWLRARDRQAAQSWHQARPWLWVGLAGGLTALCRWQVALIAVPVGVELLLRRKWRETALAALGGLLLVWIVPYSWWQMYGKLILIPATEGDKSAIVRAPVNAWRVLFSPIAGLFPWSPVAALALLGLVPLFKRDWRLASSVVVMFTLQVLVNGAVKNWWAGTGFGMRRMAELYPVYVLCLAVLSGAAAKIRWLHSLLLSVSIALALYGIALVLARMNFTWTNPWGLARDTPFKELQYTFSKEHWRLMWPVIKDHVGPWAWKKPGP